MKTGIRIGIIVFLFCLFFVLVYGIVFRTIRNNRLTEKIKTLPVFSLPLHDGKYFRSGDIKTGPVLVVYYHPECEYCQYEVNEILDNSGMVKNLSILFISFAKVDQVKDFFSGRNDLSGDRHFLLIDEKLEFKDHFGTSMLPSTFLYDKDLRLIKYFKGEVNPETLMTLFEVNE